MEPAVLQNFLQSGHPILTGDAVNVLACSSYNQEKVDRGLLSLAQPSENTYDIFET